MELPLLTADQMREIDRLLVDEFSITPLQMMENAGRNLAVVARRLLEGDLLDRPVVVLAGRGGNGGSGLAAARHLLNWGAWVQIVLTHPPEAHTGATAQQLAALQAVGAPLAWAEEGWELPPADLLIDALIGYGLRGDPTGPARNLIELANSSAAPVLSLDAPSGLDVTSGALGVPHIRAAATVTLALPKRGMTVDPGRDVCGELYLADIGVPPLLYERLGLTVAPLFARDPLLALHVETGRAWVSAP